MDLKRVEAVGAVGHVVSPLTARHRLPMTARLARPHAFPAADGVTPLQGRSHLRREPDAAHGEARRLRTGVPDAPLSAAWSR
jgi:hypothetical protein